MQKSQWAPGSHQAPSGTPEVRNCFKKFTENPTDKENKALYRNDTDVDQFAQTRQPDDLFDDDYTPITEPISHIVPHAAPRSSYPQPRGRGNQARGRGRGGFPRSADNTHNTHPTTKPVPNPTSTSITPNISTAAEASPATPLVDQAATTTTSPATNPTAPAPTSSPVRGSRLQTGGVQKPKLTESELSARLAAARLNNAKREEAHRLAEADEASFQHREAQAREKRREEGAARRVMEGERERNRLRKLGARGGREWDEGKEPEEEKARGARRGMYGGVVGGVSGGRGRGGEGGYAGRGGDAPAEDTFENPSSARGSFEGGRGRGRGRASRARGRGRGDFEGNGARDQVGRSQQQNKKAAAFEETDFPALSVDASKKAESVPTERIATLENKDILKSPTGERGTWADQVEAGAGGS
ncbi:hypothetical protein MMC11_003789 [Xylographa trunciseda]|nr:hypothetical protein [Xylographa trunciseda]